MKKAALLLSICLILVFFTLTPVWRYIYKAFEVKGLQGNYSQLQFESLRGVYEISIDDEVKGEVSDKQKKEFPQIKPGMRKIKIVRKSDVPDFFYTMERTFEFIPSSQLEISWDAGPTLESSSGSIKYFTQIVKPTGSEVFIRTFPNNATVEFDSKKSNENVYEVFDTATHYVRVSNGDGFEDYFTKINLTNEGTNKVLTNLKLVIEVYLYKEPFDL